MERGDYTYDMYLFDLYADRYNRRFMPYWVDVHKMPVWTSRHASESYWDNYRAERWEDRALPAPHRNQSANNSLATSPRDGFDTDRTGSISTGSGVSPRNPFTDTATQTLGDRHSTSSSSNDPGSGAANTDSPTKPVRIVEDSPRDRDYRFGKTRRDLSSWAYGKFYGDAQ